MWLKCIGFEIYFFVEISFVLWKIQLAVAALRASISSSEDAGFVTRKTARSATEETCYGTNDCGYHRTDQQVREG